MLLRAAPRRAPARAGSNAHASSPLAPSALVAGFTSRTLLARAQSPRRALRIGVTARQNPIDASARLGTAGLTDLRRRAEERGYGGAVRNADAVEDTAPLRQSTLGDRSLVGGDGFLGLWGLGRRARRHGLAGRAAGLDGAAFEDPRTRQCGQAQALSGLFTLPAAQHGRALREVLTVVDADLETSRSWPTDILWHGLRRRATAPDSR